MSLYAATFSTFMKRIFAPFLTFIALFIGTGFVSGSIVHMGEGINPWDVSLLAIGAVLFVLGSVFQDIQQGMTRIRGEGILLFLLLSLVLSIGIGMASGGMQHFVDTPAYSAILIPLGLGIGLVAFILKERMSLTAKEWAVMVPVVCVAIAIGIVGLREVGDALPESLKQDHHSASVQDTTLGTSSSSVAHPIDDGHGHE